MDDRWSRAGDMVPRETGPGRQIRRSGGGGISYNSTVRLEWVSREKDARGRPLRTRKPLGIKLVFPAVSFLAAGRPYFGLSMLEAHREEGSPWARDVYGRDVLVLTERTRTGISAGISCAREESSPASATPTKRPPSP